MSLLTRLREGPFNSTVELLTRRRGYVASINGDRLRTVYRYGSRYQKSGYEPHVHEAVVRGLSVGTVVLDVGAHIGFFALACALRGSRVFAFEPAPENRRILCRQIAMNRWDDRITVVSAAVGATDGEAEFFTGGETMSAALFRENLAELSPQHFTEGVEVLRVPMVTLDTFCAERRIDPSLIKIDVEGAEADVLRGATRLLGGSTRFVVEVHPDALPFMGSSVAELEQRIVEAGRNMARIGHPNRLGIYHIAF